MSTRELGWFGALVLAVFAPLRASAAPPHQAIRVSVRAAGDAGAQADPRLFPLSSLPMTELEAYDAQYEQRFPYRGIRLSELIARFDPPETVDTALLHFRNGMIIPLPFRDAGAMKRLDPMLAVAIKIGEGRHAWTRHFPALSRENEEYDDARPLTFEGNKLVVKERWHPALPPRATAVFSPWLHADSLVAIEFVQADAWFAQFDVDHAPQTHQGFDVYRQSCAYCHGAHGVGASFGSDLVRPRPLYTRQRPFARFYYHVTFRAPDAAQHGFMMPALGYMTEADARNVWLWLQAIARWNVLPYRPKAALGKPGS